MFGFVYKACIVTLSAHSYTVQGTHFIIVVLMLFFPCPLRETRIFNLLSYTPPPRSTGPWQTENYPELPSTGLSGQNLMCATTPPPHGSEFVQHLLNFDPCTTGFTFPMLGYRGWYSWFLTSKLPVPPHRLADLHLIILGLLD